MDLELYEALRRASLEGKHIESKTDGTYSLCDLDKKWSRHREILTLENILNRFDKKSEKKDPGGELINSFEVMESLQNCLPKMDDVWISVPKLYENKVFFNLKGKKSDCAKMLRNVTNLNIKLCSAAIFKNKNGNLMASFELSK